MIQVLSKEESFLLLNRKFDSLREHVVIDLCNHNKRLPAIVLSIDKQARSFTILPMNADGIQKILSGRLPDPETVQLPSSADVVHPCWNEIVSSQ